MNLTIPNTQNIDTNISFIKSLIESNLEDFENERVYSLISYFEKNTNLIPILIRNAFDADLFDEKSFFPSCIVKLDINENIISNVNLLQNKDPSYEFAYLYSFLKHPVFADAISEYKSKQKTYNYSKKFNPVSVRAKRSMKERCRAIADAHSILGKFNKEIKVRNIPKCSISIILKYRKEGYQKVQKV